MKRTQTTFTFRTKVKADFFESWLRRNENDSDYGYPKFHNQRAVGPEEVCVEYSSENEMARGVATGIELVRD